MKKIVTEFGKFRYNRLPMGMYASGYIFKSKVGEILGDIEGVKMHICDIIIFSKYCFTHHKEQLRIIFGRLSALGLKGNASKCRFGLKGVLYLGYVITREGKKRDPKKLQEIMDLGRPTTTT